MMAILLAAMALVGVGLLVLGLVVFWREPLAVLPVFERLTPNVIYRVRTERPLVALSFDDGPDPNFTVQVLEILQRHDAKATFFLIGERALRHPEVVSRIKAAGHEVGNHYFRNSPTLHHSDADFASYLMRWLIKKNLVPGAIVILHDGIRDPSRSIQALPHILDEGRARGLRFVSIGALRQAGEGP